MGQYPNLFIIYSLLVCQIWCFYEKMHNRFDKLQCYYTDSICTKLHGCESNSVEVSISTFQTFHSTSLQTTYWVRSLNPALFFRAYSLVINCTACDAIFKIVIFCTFGEKSAMDYSGINCSTAALLQSLRVKSSSVTNSFF